MSSIVLGCVVFLFSTSSGHLHDIKTSEALCCVLTKASRVVARTTTGESAEGAKEESSEAKESGSDKPDSSTNENDATNATEGNTVDQQSEEDVKGPTEEVVPPKNLNSFPLTRKLDTEWLGLELPLIGLFNTNIDMPFSPGLIVRVLTLKWENFYWTPFELGGATQIGDRHVELPSSRGAQFIAFGGTQAGLPFYLGSSGQHQFFLGLSSGFGILGGTVVNPSGRIDQSDAGLLVGAALRYTYQPGGVFNFGASVRTMFPVLELDSNEYDPFRMIVVASLDASLHALEPDSRVGEFGEAVPPFVEYLGIEWGFLSVFPGEATPPPAVGLSAILRFWTLSFKNFYWTPLEVGGGVHLGGTYGLSVYGGTQGGTQWNLGKTRHHRLRFGVGLGGGALGAHSSDGSCDGTCSMGGTGFMVSPTIRYTYYTDGMMFYGGGVRFIIPAKLDTDIPFGYGNLYGTLMSLYFEIGWGQERSGASKPAYVPVDTKRPDVKEIEKPEGRTLSISTEPEGAWVTIDGRAVGESPVSVAVPPGQHRVRVDSPGHKAMAREVNVSSDQTVHIQLVKHTPLVSWGHVSFWTGLGLVGFGGVSTWMAKEAGEEGHNSDSRAWSGAMWVGFGGGVALMATGVVLWLLEPDPGESTSDSPLMVSPVFDGTNLGVDIGVRF